MTPFDVLGLTADSQTVGARWLRCVSAILRYRPISTGHWLPAPQPPALTAILDSGTLQAAVGFTAACPRLG
jgi:hypothetical protein